MFVAIVDRTIQIIIRMADGPQVDTRHIDKHFRKNNFFKRSNFARGPADGHRPCCFCSCQFVVKKGSIDHSLHYADPDLAVDWSHVEQVRLHSMQPMKCPICLSEPQAAKITRCGHVYCWSCLLHYLALSDKAWRKCPVCSESIYKHDIRRYGETR